MHQYIYLCQPELRILIHPLCIVIWKWWVPRCGTVCMFQSIHFWSDTLFRMCTCICACIYVHPTAHVSSTPNGLVTWEPGCPCVAVCVCSSHPASGHTPCLECVHVSVCEFMHTWLPMFAPHPMHSLMESSVPMYCSVFVSQSPHFCSHTLFRMCTCISICIYVHLTPHVC